MGRETRNETQREREAKGSSAGDEKRNMPSSSKSSRTLASIALTNWNGNNDSIMNTIIAMTAPPKTTGGSDSKDKSNKGEKAGGQKKGNRAQAKESYCEGCGDAGEVMVSCKSCSVNYHPVCDDPPLDDSVKDLNWQCKSCRQKEVLKGQEYLEFGLDIGEGTSATKDKGHVPENDDGTSATNKSEKEKEPVTKGRRKVPYEVVDIASSDDEDYHAVSGAYKRSRSVNWEKELKRSFHSLINGSKVMHPTSFEIPVDFRHQYKFPGTSRKALIESGVKLQPKMVHIENAFVPRPTVCCYTCKKSARLLPLLKCDYCPEYFHLDCLVPPLTTVPGGMWMCPLHPEPFLESTRLENTAVSSRIKLWDSTHKDLDATTVVTGFFKKCSRIQPPMRKKSYLYEPCLTNLPEGAGNAIMQVQDPVTEAQFINDVMNEEFPEPTSDDYIAKKAKLFECYGSDDLMEGDQTTEQDNSADSDKKENKEKPENNVPEIEKLKDLYLELTSDENAPIATADVNILTTITSGGIENDDKTDTETKKDGDGTDAESQVGGLSLLSEAMQFLEIQESDKEKRREEFLKKLPYEEVMKLAAQRLNEIDKLVEAGTCKKIVPSGDTGSTESVTKSKSKIPLSRPISVKYTLELYFKDFPRSLKIKTSSLVIGTERGDEVGASYFNPSLFVNCNKLSDMHAVIYFDRMRLQWEILNYSPHGIIVDDVMYSLKTPVLDHGPRNELEAMKSRILARRKILVETQKNPHYEKYYLPNTVAECPCQEDHDSVVSEVTHEGSAVITVGTKIQIGCLKLIVAKMNPVEDYSEWTDE